MDKTYALEFENWRYRRTNVARFASSSQDEAIQKAISTIYKDCKKRNYNVFYIRSWPRKNEMVFDFGSHSEFYYLREVETDD